MLQRKFSRRSGHFPKKAQWSVLQEWSLRVRRLRGCEGQNISDFVLDEDLGGSNAWDVATFADDKVLLSGRNRSAGLTGL